MPTARPSRYFGSTARSVTELSTKMMMTGACSTDPVPCGALVLGLGNPILGDDGVGWKVAEGVRHRLPESARAEVDCLAVGGLALMERMLGYEHVVLVDSIETAGSPEGTVSILSLDELEHRGWGHSASAHDASLMTALRAAKSLGASIPLRIDVVAIEARNCYDFSEALSPRVAAAVPRAIDLVVQMIHPQSPST